MHFDFENHLFYLEKEVVFNKKIKNKQKMQHCSNSSALAIELLLYCTEPSISCSKVRFHNLGYVSTNGAWRFYRDIVTHRRIQSGSELM